MDSTRFPKKVLSEILGKPMIIYLIERVKKSKFIKQVIVATTTKKIDDDIAKIIKNYNIEIFRGNSEDVLDRYYKASKKHSVDIIVRITGDCPLIDPCIIDMVIQYFLDNNYDYVSNVLKPTFPDGLDVEVFSFKTIEKAWEESKLLSEREHVTSYITNHPEKFKIGEIRNSIDLSHMRWTVDYEKDLIFITEIFKKLYNKKSIFLMDDVLQLLEKHPELKKINNEFQRNEGYLKSLKEDKKFIKKIM